MKYWWEFPLFLLVLLVALFFPLCTDGYGIGESLLVLTALAVFLATIISWVFLLANKKWWQFAVSLIVTFFIVIVSLPLLGMAAQSRPDDFGKEHPIPEELEYNIPLQEKLDGSYPVAEVDSMDSSTWIQLRGFWINYTYDFYCGNLQKGDIFIRAYEVTENIPLTVRPGIGDDFYTMIDSVKTFSKLVDNKSFVIEEGEPGDYYAVRIEVWHRDAKTRKERKLAEKVYKVEGWSR